MSVWLLKGKPFLIKGPLSSAEALINTSWKWLHPGRPALGFHWDGRGGCFPKSTDRDPIFLRSLVCWLLAPIYVLPTPQSMHRRPGGKRITWRDASSKPSILTRATCLGPPFQKCVPLFSSQGKNFFLFFNSISIWDDGYSLNLLWQSLHELYKSNYHAGHLKLKTVLYIKYISIKLRWEKKRNMSLWLLQDERLQGNKK